LNSGQRLAEPGEFTRRAYLNGKLDLAQAEAVVDLIDASTAAAARSAVRSLQGEFLARSRPACSSSSSSCVPWSRRHSIFPTKRSIFSKPPTPSAA
jgi:hypothetical protein